MALVNAIGDFWGGRPIQTGKARAQGSVRVRRGNQFHDTTERLLYGDRFDTSNDGNGSRVLVDQLSKRTFACPDGLRRAERR